MHQTGSDLLEYLRVIRRHWKLFTLCALLVPAIAVAVSLQQPKKYEASASLLFRDPGFDQKLFGSTFFSPTQDPDREAATNVELVSLDVVAARTAKLLGGGLTTDDVSESVDVAADGRSDVVSVRALGSTPRRAATMANTFAQQYIDFRRNADRSKIREAQQLVQRQIDALPPTERRRASGAQLARRADELEVLASLQTGNAELVQPARPPETAASPKPVRNGILGLIVGLLIGAAAVVLVRLVDRRLHDEAEVEETVGLPVIGAVPDSGLKAELTTTPPPVEAEAFQMLRANLLYFNVKRELRSILITSGAPGDGKTTISWNLAVIAATTGSRVLLIEADLRNPQLANRLRLDRTDIGLGTVLAGHTALEDAVARFPVGDSDAGRALEILPAGPVPPNPTDLIESDRMRALLDEVESDYDLVVLDTAPAAVVPDAIPLLKRVSGVLIVARLGKSTRDGLTKLKTQLTHLDAPVLGVVVNFVRPPRGGYGYGYGYGGPSSAKTKSKTETPV